jgi:DNA-binding PadR family transcriptional regulator
MKLLSKKQGKDLVFVDESGRNNQDLKEYASSEKGVRVLRERSGDACQRRSTILAGIYCEKILARLYFGDSAFG